jgi:nucleotide-binding universal stress UspA family protein
MMTLKNILMHMDATDRCTERLKLAVDLARRHDAHLSGLYVVPESFYPFVNDGAYYPQAEINDWIKAEKKIAKNVEQSFRDFIEHEGILGEWRSEQGTLRRTVALHARYADLTIVGMGNTENSKNYIDPFLAEDVVMESGRPILVVPKTGQFDGVGKRVLVCWNASREAIRAINDAMPLLQLADEVTVLVVNPDEPSSGDHGEIPSADITLHLARHGVKAEAKSIKSDQSKLGEIILSRAFDAKVDLIVAGAYGRSEAREWLFGGVTYTLLHESTVPAFLSH